LSGISKRAPSRQEGARLEIPDKLFDQALGVTYCLTKPGLALFQCQSHRSAVHAAPRHLIDTSASSARRLSHIYLLRLSCQRCWYLDAANQSIGNGGALKMRYMKLRDIKMRHKTAGVQNAGKVCITTWVI